jgi:transcriptional regulator with XRE-family HTH domain
MSTQKTTPVVTYPALVGKILAQKREECAMKQAEMATALGMSQSAYSRLESGDSVMNISQLRKICAHLGLRPSDALRLADGYAEKLNLQHVEVVAEKPNNPAAVVIGLGLLAALFMSGS